MRDFLRLVAWLLFAVVLGLGLRSFYGIFGRAGEPPWFFIALFHTLLAMGLIFFQRRRFLQECRSMKLSWTFGPALAVLAATGILIGLSRVFSPPSSSPDAPLSWAAVGLILWVPLVEELVFRFGLSNYLRTKAGHWLGLYATSMTFALAHGEANGALLIPLGPFLLALLCDLIYWRCRFIGGAIAFHAACNATAYLFLAFDPRWLDWLNLLYLHA